MASLPLRDCRFANIQSSKTVFLISIFCILRVKTLFLMRKNYFLWYVFMIQNFDKKITFKSVFVQILPVFVLLKLYKYNENWICWQHCQHNGKQDDRFILPHLEQATPTDWCLRVVHQDQRPLYAPPGWGPQIDLFASRLNH